MFCSSRFVQLNSAMPKQVWLLSKAPCVGSVKLEALSLSYNLILEGSRHVFPVGGQVLCNKKQITSRQQSPAAS